MSGRIDWKNYDYSEGPPPRAGNIPRKAAVPRESHDPDRPPIIVSPPSINKISTSKCIASEEVAPKSTKDLSNYEEELLAKITSKQDRDRTLTYRPSSTDRGTSTPLTNNTHMNNISISGETSPSGSSSTQSTSQNDNDDPLHKSTSSSSSRLRSVTGTVHIPVIQKLVPPSPMIQKNVGEIPYDSISFPLDEDPMQNLSPPTDSPSKNALGEPPIINRQALVPDAPPPHEQPGAFVQDEYAYTSLGKLVHDRYAEDWDDGSNDDIDGYADNIEYDIQNYEEDVASFRDTDGTKHPEPAREDLKKEEEDDDDDEIILWNQARDEWNQMFQAIQQTYQSGNSTQRIAATKNSSTNNTSTIARVPSREEPLYTEVAKNPKVTSALTGVSPIINTKTSMTTNPSSREVSTMMNTTNPHRPYPDVDSEIDDDDDDKEGNSNHVNNTNSSKLDLYNDAIEKQRYENRYSSHHPQTTVDINTHMVDNSPRVPKGPRYGSKSLILDDEYDGLESDIESREKPNRYSPEHDTIMPSNTSTHIQSKPETSNRVGFHSEEMNQVHEYIPDEEEPSVITCEYDDDGTYRSEDTRSLTQDSLAGRSLNSLYSKSNLSEVEDFFSDILFLGSSDYRNPGRRPVKYKSNRRKQVDFLEEHVYQKKRDRVVRDQMRMDDDDIATDADESMTLTTVDDERTKETSTLDKTYDASTYDDFTFDDTKDEEGTFLDTVDEDDASYQETDLDESSTHLERYRKRHEGKRGNDEEDDDDPSSLSVLWGFFENSISAINQAIEVAISNSSDAESIPTESYTEKKTNRHVKSQNSEDLRRENYMRLALDSVFRRKRLMVYSSQRRHSDECDMEETLTQISLSAARARHAAKNLTYDETATIDVTKHIKIFSVILPLPLGLLFEQSSHCCWVSRIFEKGNASLLTKDKVLLGDHIVAVDDTSVVFHKVSKLCKVLSVVEDPSSVELTFIRYIGPIRHSCANMEHEGYEVVDPFLSRAQQGKMEKNAKETKKGLALTAAPNLASNVQRTHQQGENKKPEGSTSSSYDKSSNNGKSNININNSKENADQDVNKTSKFKLFKIFKRR